MYMYICMMLYIYIYVYIYAISISLSIPLSLYIYIYIYNIVAAAPPQGAAREGPARAAKPKVEGEGGPPASGGALEPKWLRHGSDAPDLAELCVDNL